MKPRFIESLVMYILLLAQVTTRYIYIHTYGVHVLEQFYVYTKVYQAGASGTSRVRFDSISPVFFLFSFVFALLC